MQIMQSICKVLHFLEKNPQNVISIISILLKTDTNAVPVEIVTNKTTNTHRVKVRLHWSASASFTASASFMKKRMEADAM